MNNGRMICPRCGSENTDDWPVTVDGRVVNGGCQECWEDECEAEWWRLMVAIDTMIGENCA